MLHQKSNVTLRGRTSLFPIRKLTSVARDVALHTYNSSLLGSRGHIFWLTISLRAPPDKFRHNKPSTSATLVSLTKCVIQEGQWNPNFWICFLFINEVVKKLVLIPHPKMIQSRLLFLLRLCANNVRLHLKRSRSGEKWRWQHEHMKCHFSSPIYEWKVSYTL